MMLGQYSYFAMLQKQREEEERRKRQYGFLMPRRYMGEDVDPEISKQARSQALLAFGLPLLAAGTSGGDFGTALAQGLQGFTGSMHDVLDQYRSQKKADEQLAYERNRQQTDDARDEEYRQAQMENIKIDNERQAEAGRAKSEEQDARRKYHEQLMADIKDPEKRKLLEPFVGGEQFDTAWLQVMKPEDKSSHASEVRLNLALEAAARAQENSNYNRQRDDRQDLMQAQARWDAAFNSERDKISAALKAGRNAGVGKIDQTTFRMKQPPTSDELLAIEAKAEQMARAAVEARLGPRPAGNAANIQRPTVPSANQVRTYDPATGTFK